ncbi:hypothetical protein ACHHYP_01893 [Achlya hypogyna]|uniref:Myb-like DNA-binding protein n=1 Tax=Achlya hypogyna TaxID=1202772 RepID=A0A1V9Z7Z0_ACHHY|nr:hypothetical protein ACHHYP_01893 [Achlya hypogyna]
MLSLTVSIPSSKTGKGSWTRNEHERFLVAIQKYPRGPWKDVAAIVGTRTVRQTQTHAQKFREKLNRHHRAARAKALLAKEVDLAPYPYDPNIETEVLRLENGVSTTPLLPFSEAIDFLIETTPEHYARDDDRSSNGGKWSREEHERFLVGIQMYPHGPWKKVAAIVQTRTTRQTQTHAQKFRQKLDRQDRALRTTQAFENRDVYTPIPFASASTETEDNLSSTPSAPLPPLADALDSLIALLENDV